MKHHLIWWINIGFVALIAFLIIGAFVMHSTRSEVSQPAIVTNKTVMPGSSFSPKEKNYNTLGDPSLQVEFKAPTLRIPDLRTVLV
jgi:hypothetical protein